MRLGSAEKDAFDKQQGMHPPLSINSRVYNNVQTNHALEEEEDKGPIKKE